MSLIEQRDVLVIAHRGSSAEAPENTLPALRLAVAQGAAAVEFDVDRTRDGVLVLMHDRDVLRTTDFSALFPEEKSATVSDLTIAELARLDAGSWKSPEYRGEPVPRLGDVLKCLRGKATPIIELTRPDIGSEAAAVVRETAVDGEVYAVSYFPRAIEDFRKSLPGAKTGYTTDDDVSVDEMDRARKHLSEARRSTADVVLCEYSLAGADYLKEMHREGLPVWAYTVNDPASWDTLIRHRVDGIITDVPAQLLAHLGKTVDSRQDS